MTGITFFDRSARFDHLVRPHVPALYRFAYRLARNRDDAEDLIQDVLTKLYPRTAEMAYVRDLKPWLLRVVYHQFVDDLRRRRRDVLRMADSNVFEIAEPVEEPDSRFEISRTAQRVGRAIGQLNREQQVLVGLHLIDGLTLEEVMHVLDVPLGTLKSRLHRTRAQLKKLLEVEPFESARRVNGREL